MKILSALFALLAVPACASTSNLPHQNTVDYVDLNHFMGRWYVIAAIPTMFEKGATNATETYTWNQEKERIEIDFRFHKNTPKGEEKKIPQKGFVYNHKSNAEWRIQPFWPLSFAYLIVDLAPDYSDTIIGVPDRQNVWIMARQPKLDPRRYQELVSKVGALGYDLNKLKVIEQDW